MKRRRLSCGMLLKLEQPGTYRHMRGAYLAHKGNAKRRNIEFMLTFNQWLTIWQDSGKIQRRGSRIGQYVMSRHGDKGPYAVGNVRIKAVSKNRAEQVLKGKGLGNRNAAGKRSLESRRRMSEAARNRPSNRLGAVLSEDTKAKIRAAAIEQGQRKRRALGITDETIRQIQSSCLSQRKLAAEYGLSRGTIRYILT